MTRTSTLAGLTLTAGLAATMSLAGAAGAAAQTSIPGDVGDSVVVRVMPERATVVVNPADDTASTITGQFTNRTGESLTCRGYPDDTGASGTVAPAPVVQASLDYYKTFPLRPDPGMAQALTVAGSTININADMGGVPTLLPGGSLAPAFGPNFAARAAISEKYADAKVKGQTGQMGTFTVTNGATRSWTAPLGNPTSGQREDFHAGAIFLCTSSQGVWAFAGYEGGEEPERDSRGVLQSGSLGRF